MKDWYRAPEWVPDHFLSLLGDQNSSYQDLFLEASEQPGHMPVSPLKLLNNTAESKGNIFDLKVRHTFKSFASL